jgi:hypothetical protein
LKRDYEKPDYELPLDEIKWTGGIGQPAGLYWLDGCTIFAAHESQAEERLLSLGAVLVATLRFDTDPRERVQRSGRVERMDAARVVRELSVEGVN